MGAIVDLMKDSLALFSFMVVTDHALRIIGGAHERRRREKTRRAALEALRPSLAFGHPGSARA
jgi:hypothetical protein